MNPSALFAFTRINGTFRRAVKRTILERLQARSMEDPHQPPQLYI